MYLLGYKRVRFLFVFTISLGDCLWYASQLGLMLIQYYYCFIIFCICGEVLLAWQGILCSSFPSSATYIRTKVLPWLSSPVEKTSQHWSQAGVTCCRRPHGCLNLLVLLTRLFLTDWWGLVKRSVSSVKDTDAFRMLNAHSI